nr:hypothetical protein BaRGS_012066 [Batillaria attramentaria]
MIGVKVKMAALKIKPLQVTAFPAFYLNVFEEPTDTGDLSDHVASLLQQYERQEGRKLDSLLGQDQGTSRKRGGDEKYEKVDVRHGDKTCHKFITKMQLFPQQCIRYKWSGSPLFISQPAGGKVPVDKCPSCGSVRKFELQLVPPLIPLLKLTGESDPAVEFGTVLVYTCSTSCWQQTDTWKEECVVLQQDPDQHLFR